MSQRSKLLIWIQAIRAPFFTASIIPLLLGLALAWYETNIFDPLLGSLVLIAGVAVHAGTNLLNDYFDQETDQMNNFYSPFNGGSRMIQNEVIPPHKILFAAIGSYFIAFVTVLGIIVLTRGIFLVFLLFIAIALGVFYTAIPVKLSYRGLGEFAVFVGFGPLGVISAYYIQTNILNLSTAIIVSIPIAFLIAMVLFLNEFQDFDADSQTGKKTMVVLIGKENAVKIYVLGIIFSYLALFISILISALPYQTMLMFLSFPLSIKAIQIIKENWNEINELLPANKLTIMIHLLSGLLLSLSLILANW